MGIIGKVFGSYSEREVKRVMPLVKKINAMEPEMEKLKDEEFPIRTQELKEQVKNGKSLDDILPEAFALVREASKRVLGIRHFDVQLIGGIILHQGRIAEMKTGEGKTFVAALPLYLNALEGKGVHLITVNDYLAKYQGEMMGKLYRFLGLSIGIVLSGMKPMHKQEAYNADITYGTNNEFGFDYLRDNMVIYKSEMVQRGLHYAVVDEIDSILIDEARTPLIISGMADKSSNLYKLADNFVKKLTPKVIVEEDVKDEAQAEDNEKYDYIVDLKAKTASLTQKGIKKAEQEFKLENFNDLDNSEVVHHVTQALRANGVMKREIDYIVKDGEVLIVDEFTGRIMYGRRYNNGLHQAIEAKEGVKIANESKTLATITFQNFFRMYDKLSGMTGTAMTEEDEFREIYNLDAIAIPTNKPLIRVDNNDIIMKNEDAKFRAIVEEIKKSHEKGQPVLVGTVSISKSEKLSNILRKEGIPHVVLNAKYHEKEAEIVAQAGKLGAVTIATNMAGRGTDIMLGGNSEFLAKQEMRKRKYSEEMISLADSYHETDDKNIIESRKVFRTLCDEFEEKIKEEKEKVIAAGGLKIIGTERHESRRIDNQLRGRSGRQGDPGESRFFISLEDDLMKLFGGDTVATVANTMQLPEDMPIEMGILTRAIRTAQKRVEGRNYSIRKSVLEYDDVMNKQRDVIYKQRKQILDDESVENDIMKITKAQINKIVTEHMAHVRHSSEIDMETFALALYNLFGKEQLVTLEDVENVDMNQTFETIFEKVKDIYQDRIKEFEEKGAIEAYRKIEKYILLKTVDEKWMNHIDDMAHLKEGIHLRAYGQSSPVDAYKIEGFDLFQEMNEAIQEDVLKAVFTVKFNRSDVPVKGNVIDANYEKQSVSAFSDNNSTPAPKEPIRVAKKVGKNEPCPCGSGKKYKYCCGKDQ